MTSNVNFWTALNTLTVKSAPPQPQAPGALAKQVETPDPQDRKSYISQVRAAAGSKPKRPGPLGPDAVAGAPRKNIAVARGRVGDPSIKKGLPTVTSTAAKIMDDYASIEDIDALLVSARLARNMKRRGFTDSTSVNVSTRKSALPVPGQAYGGVPTVNPDTSAITSKAEVSALPGLIGQTPENADPRTVQAAQKSRASTSMQKVAQEAAESMQVGHLGGAASVVTTRTPVQPALMATIRQVPDKIHDAEVATADAVASATAKASVVQVLTGKRLSAFKKTAQAPEEG